MSISVFIVDDHPAIRAGLRADLSQEADISVVGEAGTGEDALTQIEASSPDVMLLDVELPGISGVDVLRRLKQSGAHTRVLVFSMHRAAGVIRAALRAGAWGYVSKDASISQVAAGIRQIHGGEQFLGKSVVSTVCDDFGRKPKAIQDRVEDISDREKEILCDLRDNWQLKQIARRRLLSINTVKTHIQHLKQKMKCDTLAGLVAFALKNDLISASDVDPTLNVS